MSTSLEGTTGVIVELCDNVIRLEGIGGEERQAQIARDMYEDIVNAYTVRKLLIAHQAREDELLTKLNGVMGEMAQIISDPVDASRFNDRWQRAVEIGGDDFQR